MSLKEQPIPEKTRCPECGGEPLPDRVTHNLSAIGYTHDDQQHVCEDCGHEWINGVPIGEFDRPSMSEDLFCSSCEDEWMLVHRAAPKSTYVALHLKCPNCFHFTIVRRTKDDRNGGVALVGYPQISGETSGCNPYGWVDDEDKDGGEVDLPDAEDCPEPLCIEHGTGTLGCPLEE